MQPKTKRQQSMTTLLFPVKSPDAVKHIYAVKWCGVRAVICTQVGSEPILEPAETDISQVNLSHPYVLCTRARVYFSARTTSGPCMVRNNNITLPGWP